MNSVSPSTSKTNENVVQIKNRCVSSCSLSNEVEISFGLCQNILTQDPNMPQIATKFLPHWLTNEQKQDWVNLCENHQRKLKK
jgi:hypothetical protein